MQDWLEARTRTSPDQIALIDHSTPDAPLTLTVAQLHQRVEQACQHLIQDGVRSGQHVARLMSNDTEAVVTIFALMRCGAVFVPLNTRLTLAELDFQLNQADVAWLLPAGTDERLQALHAKGHRILTWDTPTSDDLPTVPHRQVDLDQSALIVHTSGTSGQPKGALLTYGNLFYSAMASAYHIGHLPTDRWLCVLPLYHVGGLSILVRAVLYGITVDLYPQFDVQTLNQALSTHPITLISLVPTMLHRLLEARTEDWHSAFRCVLLGGAAADKRLLDRCIREDIPIATTYGLSEAASQVATAYGEVARRKVSTVGKPLLFTEVQIVDEVGNAQPANQYGEVVVRGQTVMRGYYNNPSATAHTLRKGWLHTGDIGYLDDDGDLFLVQRRSDLIVSGGENVYPAEVEAVLLAHRAIEQVAVVGVDDLEWGQRVAAALVLANNYAPSAEAVIAYCREHLAGYKIPRKIQFVRELPLTGSGKIQRDAVRALFHESEEA
ncbi:MAG: o-succinylbenzoate--CoA ligase [Anaerolineae bacterium]